MKEFLQLILTKKNSLVYLRGCPPERTFIFWLPGANGSELIYMMQASSPSEESRGKSTLLIIPN